MRNLPTNFNKILKAGYVGYSPNRLENVFNPPGARSVGSELSGRAQSIMAELSRSPNVLQGEREIYDISLIGARLNGFTSFEPRTDSNGDRIDQGLVPNLDERNKDEELGIIYPAREFKPAY